MKYKYQINYEGNSYTANTAAETARILRSIDEDKFYKVYEADVSQYLRGNPYAIKKWKNVLDGVITKSEVPHVNCDHCGKAIYKDSTVFYVDGYSVNFCSPACAGYYFLDIKESKLEIE